MGLKNKILVALLAGLIPALITVGYKVFGPIIFIFSYFTPLPFFIVSIKYNYINLFISAFTSLLIVILFSSFNTLILFFIINIIPAIIVVSEKHYKNKLTYGNIISKITAIKCIIFLLISYFYQENIIDFSNKFYENLKSLTNQNLFINEQMITIIPAIIVSSWIIILVFNLIVAKNLVHKNDKNLFNDKILFIKIPNWLCLFFIIIILPITILNYDVSWLTSVAIILSIPLTIQGLFVLHSICKNMTMGSFLLYSSYGILFFIPISMSLIVALGVLENLYNFRNLNYKKY